MLESEVQSWCWTNGYALRVKYHNALKLEENMIMNIKIASG